jgi:predicted TPR repeat methyltransferase
VDALHFLGLLRHQQDRDPEAIDLIRRSLELDPDYVDARSNLGNIYRLRGDMPAALREYRRVLDLSPKMPDTLNNLGTVLSREGDLKGAAEAYRKAIAIEPDHGEAWLNLGNVFRRAGRYEEAANAYRQALEIDNSRSHAYLSLGRALYLAGKLDEAAAVYRRWIDAEPENEVAHHMLAACTGKEVPARASDGFLRRTFDTFSSDFDEILTRLKYQAPKLVADALGRALPTDDSDRASLDAGCGTGLCGPLLRPFAKTLVGVDLSGPMISKAEGRGCYDDLFEGELTEYLREHGPIWDGIASADVFVYFGDLAEVLSAAAAALRPGGVIAFTTERAEEADAPAGFLLTPTGRYAHSRSHLDRTLADAGLAPLAFEEVRLRMESGEPVSGTLAVARKG